MNRLILIGNGFDLAHGLKTTYKNFIHGYLKTVFTKAYHDGSYKDELIHIEKSYGKPISDISKYIDEFLNKGIERLLYGKPINDENPNGTFNVFNVTILSIFFEKIITSCIDANWVDIENEFYTELKRILHDTVPINFKADKLSALNESLGFLIKRLGEYLETIETPKGYADYVSIFESFIQQDDVPRRYPENTLILNFNYTPTIEKYSNNGTVSKINYIHGKLGSKENPIIFGFGDELDEDYLKMELEKTKGFFKYIKSFWYFKTSNYSDLIRFIDSEHFQVYILGHSCGLSDRTMLNMIFEHDNCKLIKIYYHGDKDNNNYTTLTEEISRHFKNKGEMRRKIVPFDKSEPMPQVH